MNIEDIKNSTIFAVDDNKENLRVLVQYLSNLGFDVTPLRSGEELLNLIQERIPDLILLDIMMPEGIDGYETCRQLKANEATRDIPVIFMSALTDTFDKVAGFDLGAVDYITKPFETEEVLARIETHLALRNMQRELKSKNKELQIAENELKELNKKLKKKVIKTEKQVIEKGKALEDKESKYQTLFKNMSEGFCLNEPIVDKNGNPVDFRFLEINPAFENIIGLKSEKVIGKNVRDVIPGIENDSIDYIGVYGKVALTGEGINFEAYSKLMQRWYQFNCFSPEKGICISIFFDITERKQIDDELQKSKLILSEAERIGETASWEYDIPNNKPIWSDQIYHLLGYKLNEIKPTFEAYVDCIHPDDKEEVVNRFSKGISENEKFDIEHRFKLKDGTIKHVISRCEFFNDQFENPVNAIGVVQDITEQKLTEKALKESEGKYRSMFDNMISGFGLFEVIYDENDRPIDCRYIDVNPAFEKLTGLKSDNIIGRTMRECIPGTEDSWIKSCGKVDKTGEPRQFEDYVKEFNSWYKIYMYSTMPGFVAIIFDDISERKHAEEELTKLNLAVEQSPVCVVITDINGNIEYVNQQFYNLTGYSEKEIIGKNPRVLNAGTQPKEHYKEMWKFLKAGNIWNGEFHNRTARGELFWENAIISPVKNKTDQITHFIAVKENITDKKKLWDDLVVAKEKAEESDRLKSAFLASMSHEIRTPLNSIVGFSNIIAEASNDSRMIKFSDIISKQNNHLLKLINDILDFAKVEVGALEMVNNNFDLNNLIDELTLIFSSEFSTNTNLIPEKKSESLFIFSDQYRIKQVFSNLITNALKFTQKGTVTFGYELSSKSKITCFVKDTGMGIPKDQHKEIFERFTKINTFSKGTGLGLPISKKIIELLGGNIWLESELGKGSNFYFTIPVSIQKPEAKIVALDVKKTKSNDEVMIAKKVRNILVAEDDEANFLYIKSLLEIQNCNIIHASNGLEAVDEVKKNDKIDLVLMDIKMPVMDGYEATRQIKQIKPQLPVIALTAYALLEDQMKTEDAGCNGYISKPIVKNKLLSLIKQITTK